MTDENPPTVVQSFGWLTFQRADSFKMPRSSDTADSLVYVLCGARMTDHDALFAEFASVLDFPDYFGSNWPALEDCLYDLEWLDEFRSVELIIEDWPLVLRDAPIDLPVLCRILNDVGRIWSESGRDGSGLYPVPFTTIALS